MKSKPEKGTIREIKFPSLVYSQSDKMWVGLDEMKPAPFSFGSSVLRVPEEKKRVYLANSQGERINFQVAPSEEKQTIGRHIEEQRPEGKSPDNEECSRMFGIFNLSIHPTNYYSVVETLSGAGEI